MNKTLSLAFCAAAALAASAWAGPGQQAARAVPAAPPPAAPALPAAPSGAAAARSPEGLAAGALEGLAEAARLAPARFSASRYVRVSGDADLSGTAFVQERDAVIHLSLGGSVDVTGPDGIRSGYTSIHEYVTLPRTGNYVSHWVQVRANVSLYRNGRYLGPASVSGTVHVSGFISGTYVRVSGRGALSGDVFIRDE